MCCCFSRLLFFILSFVDFISVFHHRSMSYLIVYDNGGNEKLCGVSAKKSISLANTISQTKPFFFLLYLLSEESFTLIFECSTIYSSFLCVGEKEKSETESFYSFRSNTKKKKKSRLTFTQSATSRFICLHQFSLV